MITGLDDVAVRNRNSGFRQGPVETDEPLLRNGSILPMDEGDFPVASRNHVFRKLVFPLDIRRKDGTVVIVGIVNRNGRNLGIDQLPDILIRIVHIRNQDPVAGPVAGVLQEGSPPPCDVPADEEDVVAILLRLNLRRIQNCREEFMGQADIRIILEEDADRVGGIRLQLPGRHIRRVVHLLRHLPDPLSGLFADVSVSVQGLADRRGGNSAFLSYVLDCNHVIT